MAKQQTFADKSKAKSRSDFVVVQCIFSVRDEEKDSWKFRERFVKVKDVKEAESFKAEDMV